MPDKKYKVPVFNTATGEYETTCLDEEQYNAFRRGEWNIENNDRKSGRKEIPFGSLFDGGNECGDAFEGFHEFVSADDDPQRMLDESVVSDALAEALFGLDRKDLALILALTVEGKTVREYAKEVGEHRNKVHRSKARILKALRKRLEKKIF